MQGVEIGTYLGQEAGSIILESEQDAPALRICNRQTGDERGRYAPGDPLPDPLHGHPDSTAGDWVRRRLTRYRHAVAVCEAYLGAGSAAGLMPDRRDIYDVPGPAERMVPGSPSEEAVQALALSQLCPTVRVLHGDDCRTSPTELMRYEGDGWWGCRADMTAWDDAIEDGWVDNLFAVALARQETGIVPNVLGRCCLCRDADGQVWAQFDWQETPWTPRESQRRECCREPRDVVTWSFPAQAREVGDGR
jgi:hypothetical protein